jgi:hypothetical protein
MAGHRRAEAASFFERLCPAMTHYQSDRALVSGNVMEAFEPVAKVRPVETST